MNTPDPTNGLPPGWWQRVRHDLRGAVAPARMAVQLLRTARIDAAEREEALAVIDRQLEQLLAGIDDVGDLLRMQAGLPLLHTESHDANLLLDVVCGRGGVVRGLAARELRLHCQPCDSELPWQHDPQRVAALLEYLLLRLAAHAATGSELRMDLRRADDGAELRMAGAGASLARDAELAFLLGESAPGDEPGLRALLMREVLRGNGIDLRRDGEGALAMRLRGVGA